MKHKRTIPHFIIAAAVLVLLSLTLSACGAANAEPEQAETGDEAAAEEAAEEPAEEEVKEISVLYLDDPPFWKEQAERFTEETGIQVNWEGVGFLELHDKVLTALAAGDSPWDVVHVRDDYVAEWGSRGFLMPLDDYVTDELVAGYPSQAWSNLTWDGVQYGVPRYFWMWQFYYNEPILGEVGFDAPPATWDELMAMADDITADTDGDGETDRWGYCEPWGENFASYPFLIHLRAAGGELFDAEGNPAFNSPAGVTALSWMVEMAESGNVCPSAFELTSTGNMAELFAQGNIGMMAGTTQTFRLADDPEGSNVVGQVRAALMPGDEVPTATFAETGGLAIPATADNPDLAWEYIKFVTSFEEEKAMAMTLSSIPAQTEALTDPEVQETYEHFQYVEEQMENPFGIIRHPNATEVNAAIARHVIAALNGVESPEEALDLAAQEVASIIE